nr:uncharacterized protein LOC104095744 [Nicotiana tomentosiformis]
MGFPECFINMVWNLLANSWYSVLINGQASDFFHSTKGVKQGDPLSPALFILSVEVLSLSKYEHTSGQMINKAKSSFYMHYNVVGTLLNSMGAITGFTRGEFLLTYLGYQIFYTRRRKDYYNDLIKKVKAELHSWKGKLLSYGGKATLISSVLQSMPTHILYVLDPPDNVLEHLHKTFARFFRNNKEEGRSRHWTKWQNLCLPKEEGGVDFPINEELHEVADLRADDGWNEKLLEQSFPRDIADPIRLEAKFDNTNE